jgi:hypothetical protein
MKGVGEEPNLKRRFLEEIYKRVRTRNEVHG